MVRVDKILDRVVIFAKYLKMSSRSFSLSIGASQGYLSRLQKENSNIGGDFIEKIIELYPQLNPAWLVSGRGEMLKIVDYVNDEGAHYGKPDFFKEALLNYLDDPQVKDKLMDTVKKEAIRYAQSKRIK